MAKKKVQKRFRGVKRKKEFKSNNKNKKKTNEKKRRTVDMNEKVNEKRE